MGAAGRTARVRRALESLEVRLEPRRELPAVLAADDIGVVLCPDPVAGAARVVQGFRRSAAPSLPVFVVVDDGTADAASRSIYRAGATAVFHWPREGLVLGRLVAELLGLAWVRGPADRADTALARAVRAHLRLTCWPAGNLRIDSREGGVVHVSGATPTLPRKREVERLVAAVPGVQQVVTGGLGVEPSGRPDRSIATKVRSVLAHTAPADARTVSVSVRNGNVVLAGNVPDRRSLRRIDRLASQVLGVRSINNLLAVAPRSRRRDGSLAGRLQTLLSTRFPHVDLDVSVFSGVAVISGTVESLAGRREVEEYVDDHVAEVERVVNKLDVA